MKLRERTRELFAGELETMLTEMPFSAVRVLELSKRCGATPQTFYYHFRDKAELAAWIFLRDVLGGGDVTARLMERKDFYQKIFDPKTQGPVEAFLREFAEEYLGQAVKQSEGRDWLSNRERAQIAYHCAGTVGVFRDWLWERTEPDLSVLAAYWLEELPDFLGKALKESALRTGGEHEEEK